MYALQTNFLVSGWRTAKCEYNDMFRDLGSVQAEAALHPIGSSSASPVEKDRHSMTLLLQKPNGRIKNRHKYFHESGSNAWQDNRLSSP